MTRALRLADPPDAPREVSRPGLHKGVTFVYDGAPATPDRVAAWDRFWEGLLADVLRDMERGKELP